MINWNEKFPKFLVLIVTNFPNSNDPGPSPKVLLKKNMSENMNVT